jgi:hypothetical protein
MNQPPELIREREIYDLLIERHPESKELLLELDHIGSLLLTIAEDEAVVVHGQQILAALEGRGFAGAGSRAEYDADSQWTRALERAVSA